MAIDAHVFDLLPAYALDALEEAETRLVATHVAGCLICRVELHAFQEAAADLALAAPAARPSADLKSRLAARITGPQPIQRLSTPRNRLRQLLPAAGAAGLALLLILLVTTFVLWQRLNTPEVLAGPHGMRAIALQNTSSAPGASGFVILGADGMNGVLVVDQLPTLDSQHEYQLWLERDGESISGAIFSVDERGYRGVRIEAPETLLDFSSVRITIEPLGGSVLPTGEQVLDGSLFNP